MKNEQKNCKKENILNPGKSGSVQTSKSLFKEAINDEVPREFLSC